MYESSVSGLWGSIEGYGTGECEAVALVVSSGGEDLLGALVGGSYIAA